MSVTVAILALSWARRTLPVPARAIGGIDGDMVLLSIAAVGDVFLAEG